MSSLGEGFSRASPTRDAPDKCVECLFQVDAAVAPANQLLQVLTDPQGKADLTHGLR